MYYILSNNKIMFYTKKKCVFQDKPEVGVCGYSGRKFIQRKYYNEKEHGHSITYEDYLTQMKS
jgi:hypothetical protein